MEPKEIRKRLLNIDEQLLDLHSLISKFLCDVELPDRATELRNEAAAGGTTAAPLHGYGENVKFQRGVKCEKCGTWTPLP